MGLNFNYLLYFEKQDMWAVLKALGEMEAPYDHQPTVIHFPDHDLVIPLTTAFWKGNELQYDEPAFEFNTTLQFDADETILEYMADVFGEEFHRSPPGEDGPEKIGIGLISLTLFADLEKHYGFKKPSDLCLFEFGTTGTRMSFLFQDSASIRNTFINLLERFRGVTGIFDREIDGGELFWFKGRRLSEDVLSVHMLPEEIETMLKRGW